MNEAEDRYQEGYDEGYGEGYYANQDDCDEKLAEIKRKLVYTRESRDAHSAGWTNCVIELGETKAELKKAQKRIAMLRN